MKWILKSNNLFVAFAMLAGFSIAAEYGITRPTSQALFVTLFSAKALPWAWLATVPLNFLVISLYNRFLSTLGPPRMLTTLACITMGINSTAAFILPWIPSFIFFQYMWKDVYILLMFKQLWSMIHTTISSARAKSLYGLIFGMGTLGSILGSQIPTHYAAVLTSEKLYLFTLPIYLLLIFFYRTAFRHSLAPQHSFEQHYPTSSGFALIRQNRLLITILLLVVLMQTSVGLMEYRFNAHLELNILDKDLRTAYCGRLVGWMNVLSGFFQIIGGFLMVRTLGLRKSHLLIPILLLLSATTSWMIPSFALISCSYVFLKAIDFSLFGVLREMFYIPLALNEKFRAKAIIDVFAYRTSKAITAIALLLFQSLVGASLLPFASYLSITLFLLWIGLIYFTLRREGSLAVVNVANNQSMQ